MFPKVQAKEGSANPVFLVQAIRNTSSAIVPSVIREIEIWRVAVLMLSRYAGDAEANSFQRAEELGACPSNSDGERMMHLSLQDH